MNGRNVSTGGTCTGAMEGWVTRVTRKDGNPKRLGRWSTLCIQIKGTRTVFITAYQVCKAHVNLETNTAYAQEWKELILRSSTNAYPRGKNTRRPKEMHQKRYREQAGGSVNDGRK